MLGDRRERERYCHVSIYLSDVNVPFVLGEGDTFSRASASEILDGVWDAHLALCEAEWAKQVAEHIMKHEPITWQLLATIYRAL